MSDKSSSNEQLENVKRHASELVADMRSRNLLLPAIVLVVAIVAAMIVLPDKSEPTLQSTAQPVVNTQPASVENPIEITLITPTAVGDGAPLTSSSNPFAGSSDYTCTTVSSGPPRVLECEVSDLKVRVTCPETATGPPCESSSGGGATGGGSSGSSGSAGGGSGSGGSGGNSTPVVVYVYKATVVYDGKTYKDIEQGDKIPPKSSNALVSLMGVNDTGSRAMFELVEGATVTGVTADETGKTFVLKPGQTATITDEFGDAHKLKLTKISKVKA